MIMRRFNKHIVCLIFFISNSYAAELNQFSFNGKYFSFKNNILMVQESDHPIAYEVNTSIITVKPKDGFNQNQIDHFFRENQFLIVRKSITGFFDVKIIGNNDYQSKLMSLSNSKLFAVIEPNTFGTYALLPNDNNYAFQWHYAQLMAEEAWQINSGDPSVVVAVLDSGTEYLHEDLGTGVDSYGNIWINAGEDAWLNPYDPSTGNGIDDDNNGYIDDWKGYNFYSDSNDGSGINQHGTAIAGIVAAKTNNNLGVAGMAGGDFNKGVSLMIGNVGDFVPDSSVLDDAILYAAQNGAKIIQLSLTMNPNAAIDAAINVAYDTYGVLIINAAGNAGISSVSYPASHANVMAVGASNQLDQKANLSQYGSDLEVMAPGIDIFSTSITIEGRYGFNTGTSYAAPLVSGIAGLIFSYNSELTHVDVREILKLSADKVGNYNYGYNASFPGRSFEMGYGRVNAYQALLLAENYEPYSDIIFINSFQGVDNPANF